MQISVKGFQKILQSLGAAKDLRDEEMRKALLKVGLIAQDGARDRAPISPTKSQYNKTLKTKKKSTQQFNPGGLVRSIDMEYDEEQATVFISSSSEAGSYAEFIHDGTYNLGIGSEAKEAKTGEDIGDRFIERSIDDQSEVIKAKIQQAVTKVIDRANK